MIAFARTPQSPEAREARSAERLVACIERERAIGLLSIEAEANRVRKSLGLPQSPWWD